jgi:hypothetical protein
MRVLTLILAVLAVVLSAGALAVSLTQAGPRGPQGAVGPRGPAGAQGSSGLSSSEGLVRQIAQAIGSTNRRVEAIETCLHYQARASTLEQFVANTQNFCDL